MTTVQAHLSACSAATPCPARRILLLLPSLTLACLLCHQIGSFLGGWLGGYVYDTTGSYGSIWTACIVGSVVATVLVLLVKEEEEEEEVVKPAAGSKEAEVVGLEEGKEEQTVLQQA